MPRTKKATAANADEKLKVVERIRVHYLEHKTIANNNGPNKSPYLKGIQEGAVYANLDEIEAGKLYTVVRLSNDMIALNEPTLIERMKFIGQLAEESGLTAEEVKAELGL